MYKNFCFLICIFRINNVRFGKDSDTWELFCTALHFRSHLRTSPIDRLGYRAISPVCFSMVPSRAKARWCTGLLWLRWLGPLTDSTGYGIVWLSSVPAQLEVINTRNLIQRQETPLPSTELKLNALLFFLAKPRFAWLTLTEPDIFWPGGGQWRLFW